jgi:hypothetical protein
VYCLLSEAEHGRNHTRTQLELTQEKLNMRTHPIVHVENAIKMHDLELDDMVEWITTLVQQVHKFQILVPPTPEEDPIEVDVMSRVEEG